jgi:hypothetical protein
MESPSPQKLPVPKEVEQLTYELFVLRRMLQQLPGKTGELMLIQYDKVIAAMNERDRVFREKVTGLVDDAILEVKLQEFDLEATRRERDELRDQS